MDRVGIVACNHMLVIGLKEAVSVPTLKNSKLDHNISLVI